MLDPRIREDDGSMENPGLIGGKEISDISFANAFVGAALAAKLKYIAAKAAPTEALREKRKGGKGKNVSPKPEPKLYLKPLNE